MFGTKTVDGILARYRKDIKDLETISSDLGVSIETKKENLVSVQNSINVDESEQKRADEFATKLKSIVG